MLKPNDKKPQQLEEPKAFVRDPELWDQSFEMGPEGLIATIDDPKQLLDALKEEVKRKSEKLNVNQARMRPS